MPPPRRAHIEAAKSLLLPLLSPIASTVITLLITVGALVVNAYMWSVELHVLPLAMTLVDVR